VVSCACTTLNYFDTNESQGLTKNVQYSATFGSESRTKRALAGNASIGLLEALSVSTLLHPRPRPATPQTGLAAGSLAKLRPISSFISSPSATKPNKLRVDGTIRSLARENGLYRLWTSGWVCIFSPFSISHSDTGTVPPIFCRASSYLVISPIGR
jgi:hypothetical protein